jgi:hypothetical protein
MKDNPTMVEMSPIAAVIFAFNDDIHNRPKIEPIEMGIAVKMVARKASDVSCTETSSKAHRA